MKVKVLLTLCVLALLCCKNQSKEVQEDNAQKQDVKYASFGKEISADDAIIAASMMKHYKTMQNGDSIPSKLKAKVKEVCQVKGCWMTLDIGSDTDLMVKFKDYGFFVPTDISGEEVIINGKAFVKSVSVEELRHYAEDAGKSAEDIADIKEPKRSYAFEADGVLVTQ